LYFKFLKEIYEKSPTLIEEPRPTDGCTPLLCAVKCNNLNSIVLLLSCGAKVNAVDLSGNTSLHHAVMAKNAQIVKLLLIFRANLNVANKTGRMPTSLKTRFSLFLLFFIFHALF
jgi:ankyrin repeat protein